jgi:Putative Ig domain
LPEGLTFSTNGVLSGTPTTAGLYAIVISLADDAGQVAGTALNLNVTDTLSVPATSTTLPGGAVGMGYSAQLTTNYASGVWSFYIFPLECFPRNFAWARREPGGRTLILVPSRNDDRKP